MALSECSPCLFPRFLGPAWTGSRVRSRQLRLCNDALGPSPWRNGSHRALPRNTSRQLSSLPSSPRISSVGGTVHRCYGTAALHGLSFGSRPSHQQHSDRYIKIPQLVRGSNCSNRAITSRSTPRRSFHVTARQLRDHYFDTLKVVQRLKEEGFSEEQAVAMMRVLSDVIEESIQNLTRTMVLREDQDKATYTQKVDFAKLRSDLLSADSTESSVTRASHERLSNELAKLNSRLRDEIARTQASVRLDLNLEKGRIREEANVQELKIKETNARIEQEVASLRERVEGIKFSTLQWLMGVCTGTAAIILGAWRLLM